MQTGVGPVGRRSNRTILRYFWGKDNFIFKSVLLNRFWCRPKNIKKAEKLLGLKMFAFELKSFESYQAISVWFALLSFLKWSRPPIGKCAPATNWPLWIPPTVTSCLTYLKTCRKWSRSPPVVPAGSEATHAKPRPSFPLRYSCGPRLVWPPSSLISFFCVKVRRCL